MCYENGFFGDLKGIKRGLVAAMGDVLTGAVLERSIELIGNYRFNNERELTNPDHPASIL